MRTTYIEIFLAKLLRTRSDRAGPMRHSVNCYRKAFVNAVAINVQGSQGHTRESFDLGKDIWSPFT